MDSVSVIIPNYNHARFLPAALDSLLSQSLPPKEVLIFDDASTDDSTKVIGDYIAKEPRIRLFRSDENQGPIPHMNRGLKIANSRYVFFMAADDVVLPDFLESSLQLLSRHRAAGLCSSMSKLIDEQGEDRGIYRNPLISDRETYVSPPRARRFLLSHGPWFMGNTTVYRRDALLEAGGFDPELKSFCDGFVSQVLTLRHGACFVPRPLGCWRRMETGYAQAHGHDWQPRLELRERATELMRTKFQDAFPADFVRACEQQDRFAAGVAASRAIRSHLREMLDEMIGRLCPRPGAAERICRLSIALLEGLTYIALRLYLFLRFRGVRFSLWRRIERLKSGGRRVG